MPITNLTRNTSLADIVHMANTPLKRLRGLLGRTSLARQEALIITPCQSIHMVFMKFAIDVIFVDRHNIAIGLVKNIKPYAFSPIFFKSVCAIELSAGTIEATNTQVGDQLKIWA